MNSCIKHCSLAALVAVILLGGLARISAQDAAPLTTVPAAAAPTATTKTLWQQIVEGGWVMIPIGVCSVATIYLIADGVIRTGQDKIAPIRHEQRLRQFFQGGDYVGAYQYCKANPCPLTNVLRVGISLLGEGKQITEEGMMGELSKENSHLQTWISYLSVIGVCSPMIGLLGTVTGMIRAFATLGSAGIGDPASLSSAIGEVLTATASGLFIAIPAFMAFYFLRNRAAAAIHHIQDIIASLYRRMPYDSMGGVQIGDEVIYAAVPNWVQPQDEPTTT